MNVQLISFIDRQGPRLLLNLRELAQKQEHGTSATWYSTFSPEDGEIVFRPGPTHASAAAASEVAGTAQSMGPEMLPTHMQWRTQDQSSVTDSL